MKKGVAISKMFCYLCPVFLLQQLCDLKLADIAQLVEHLTCNENVLRSIRGIGSKIA